METIGAVFTPLPWGRFAVARSGVLGPWLAGATVLDPTMGTGNLMAALVDAALATGISAASIPFERLWGIELDAGFREEALQRFLLNYGVDMGEQFVAGDVFELDGPRCDFILGNPPWANFDALPDALKPLYRTRFVQYGLVTGAHKVLLGRSRTDVASLVVQKTMATNLNPGGQAWYFLPLSLLFSDGAHETFRQFRCGSVTFSPTCVYDFRREAVFRGISTRFGLVGFARDRPPAFPIPFHFLEGGAWHEHRAGPAFRPTDPLSVSDPESPLPWESWTPIAVPRGSMPRQGVNTGGANRVFFFDQWEPLDDESCLVNGSINLPRRFVHPLIGTSQFRDPGARPQRWVLLPCGIDGKPLTAEELATAPSLKAYLESQRDLLSARKGTLLGAWRARGIWWALLGMGPYCFAPYKIVWEAYGRREFWPVLLGVDWQANQSLQAFIPCWDESEAQRIVLELRQPAVEAYLRSLQMEGTMTWAQPGRIRNLLVETSE